LNSGHDRLHPAPERDESDLENEEETGTFLEAFHRGAIACGCDKPDGGRDIFGLEKLDLSCKRFSL
jgi:hypothetical protein